MVAQLAPPAKLPDRLHNVREAAHYLRLTPEGVRKARRQPQVVGVHLKRSGAFESRGSSATSRATTATRQLARSKVGTTVL
jgi:hypothetical protein